MTEEALNSSTIIISKKERKYRCLLKQNNNHVYDSLSDEEMDEELSGAFYIEPNSKVRFIFDTIVFILSIYSLIFTPYSVAFDLYEIPSKTSFTTILEIIIDCIFFLDMFMGFITAYYDFEEQLITRANPIVIQYLTGWFFLDLISAFPFNSIVLILKSNTVTFKSAFTVEPRKILEVFRLFRLFKLTKVFLNNSFMDYIEKISMDIDCIAQQVFLYLFLFIGVSFIHVLACLFIFFGQMSFPNWISVKGYEITEHALVYIASIYFVCATITTVGYGDIVSIHVYERCYTVFLITGGFISYSIAVSSLIYHIKKNDSKNFEYQKRVEIFEQICVAHGNIPKNLKSRVMKHLVYRYKNNKKDKNEILDNLPTGLKNRLIMEMYKDIINNFMFFRKFNNTDFILSVVSVLKEQLVSKGERLVDDGDYIEEMVFVKRGALALEAPLPVIVKEETLERMHSRKTKANFGGTHIISGTTINMQQTLAQGGPDEIEYKETLYRTKSGKSFVNQQNVNKPQQHYMKILEIRKNEHFGDILMFLNMRSPLSVKVRTKTAEILLLKKTDAVEISMSFPRIWRKIIRKSLFNMEQIERLINKKLQLFFIYNEGKLKKGKMPKKHYYHRDVTKKNTYLNSKELFNTLLIDEEGFELQSLPTEEEDEEDDYDEGDLVMGSEMEEKEDDDNEEDVDNEDGTNANNNNNKANKVEDKNNYDTIREETSEEYYEASGTEGENGKSEKSDKDKDNNNNNNNNNKDKAAVNGGIVNGDNNSNEHNNNNNNGDGSPLIGKDEGSVVNKDKDKEDDNGVLIDKSKSNKSKENSFVSSDSSVAQTVKISIKNSLVDFDSDSDDVLSTKNVNGGAEEFLISLGNDNKKKKNGGFKQIENDIYPYGPEEINKEFLPFEDSIKVQNNLNIHSIFPQFEKNGNGM
jgi:CRP-like cAMP-binding protein